MTLIFGSETVHSTSPSRSRFLLPAFAALLGLAACSPKEPPPPPPPTLVNVQLSATKAANATADGIGAPVLIRVYQLASKAGFDKEEFFHIYKEDTTVLGPDLLKKDEFLLIPGTAKSLALKPADAVHAIGVFAAYRDFQSTFWRASADVPAHQTTNITVSADRPGIKLDAAPAKPASN